MNWLDLLAVVERFQGASRKCGELEALPEAECIAVTQECEQAKAALLEAARTAPINELREKAMWLDVMQEEARQYEARQFEK